MLLLVGGNSEIGAATARRLRARGRAGSLHDHAPRGRARPRARSASISRDCPDDWRPPQGVAAACIFVAVARLAACEADPAGSDHVNVTQTLALAERLIAQGVYTLFLSTNQVFDGTRPRTPADAPLSPVSEYGRQKAATDGRFQSWIAVGAPAGVLRLAKVVSPDMALLHGWSRKLALGEPIRAFSDMKMAPTPTSLVAEAIGCMLAERTPAIAQLTGPEDVSYDEVARYIARRAGAASHLVSSVSAHEDGAAVGSTPPNTTLDSGYLNASYGILAPGPWSVVELVLAS